MKYVFFGTPEFADIILNKLIDSGFPPALVVSNPDRPVGRKKIITPPPTKITAQKHGIKTWQPEKLTADSCEPEFNGAGFAVVAAYTKILPMEVLKLFPMGVIGVHPSLLPKYRGSSPIQATILDGDKKTGVTLFLLDKKVDHGPILAQRELEFSISNFQFPNLLQKLAELGGELLSKTLPKFLNGKIQPQPQNELYATYTRKLAGENAFVEEKDLKEALAGNDPEMALAIERKIRALNPEPGVWTRENGKRLKLLEAEVKENRLVLRVTQLEGEKPRRLAQ